LRLPEVQLDVTNCNFKKRKNEFGRRETQLFSDRINTINTIMNCLEQYPAFYRQVTETYNINVLKTFDNIFGGKENRSEYSIILVK